MNQYIEKLSKISIKNKYFITYVEIVSRNIGKTKAELKHKHRYVEKHHIFPSCVCSDSQRSDTHNLVYLSAREHFICHRLLQKFTIAELKNKMTFAVWSFTRSSNNQQRVKIVGRVYEQLKKDMSDILRNTPAHNKGKIMSEAQKEKLRGKKKTQETRNKISETQKQKAIDGKLWVQSNEGKLRLSECAKGEKNSFYGKKHSDTTKKHLSKVKTGIMLPPRTDKHIKNLSEALKGRSQQDLYGERYESIIEARRAQNLGKTLSIETRQKMSNSHRGKTLPKTLCPHCNKLTASKRWHFDNCKFKYRTEES
jgi:hypothetical protein